MKEIGMFLHIPYYAGDCACEMIQQIKHIRETLFSSMKVYEEWRQLNLEDPDLKNLVYSSYQHNGKLEVYRDKNWSLVNYRGIPKSHLAATLYLSNPVDGRIMHAGCTASFVRYPLYEMQMVHEVFFYISFDYTLWQLLDQTKVIQCLKEAYLALNATYAWIDESIGSYVLAGQPFCLLANAEDDCVGMENHLSAIKWFQIVSEDCLKNSGTLHEIAMKAPCEHVEILKQTAKSSILLQLTDELKSATRKKRLALRECLQESLFEFSIKDCCDQYFMNLHDLKYETPHGKSEVIRKLKILALSDEEILQLQEKYW